MDERQSYIREVLRGGVLFLIRWVFQYPLLHLTYRFRYWTRAPFLIQPEWLNKPGILVSNYGNYFFDQMLGLTLAPVWPFSFMRDSYFKIPILGFILKFFRMIPFIRSSDRRYNEIERKLKNQDRMKEVAERLRKGHWFLVFPEMNADHQPQIAKTLRPGVANVALKAEDMTGWSLGLRIYIYGSNYENKFIAGSNVYIRWATPIEVKRYQSLYAESTEKAEQQLMTDIENALKASMFESNSLEVLEDAHRLAFQQNRRNFSGVMHALEEIKTGSSKPEVLHRIVYKRARESRIYQVGGVVLLLFGSLLGWPFRAFAKICSTNRSQEMTFQFILWSMVLVTGILTGGIRWIYIQAGFTWIAMSSYLWGWRWGLIK